MELCGRLVANDLSLRVAQSDREIDTSYIERVFAQEPSYYPGDGGWMHGFHPSGSDESATLFR